MSPVTRLTGGMAVVGLILLYLGGTLYAPPEVSPGGVAEVEPGTLVTVTGTVSEVREHEGTRFFTLTGRDTAVEAVAFDGEIPAGASGRYAVTGRVDIYEGDRELVVRDVSRVDAPHTPG